MDDPQSQSKSDSLVLRAVFVPEGELADADLPRDAIRLPVEFVRVAAGASQPDEGKDAG
ncbi:MAG: hypothetical protein JO227_03025 [Acetobacteraceae bacterium]|nr:hypothetical protein [Acetobacteraceae bacterium]